MEKNLGANNRESLDPWFITGFSDGEAAFTFSRSGEDVFALYFSICQREDNRGIVDKIQEYFNGIGKIYIRKEQLPKKNSGRTKPSAYFRVCKQKELLRIIEHFDKFPLQSKKQEVYQIWREMAIEKTRCFLNCKSEKFKIFSEAISVLNQKSRAFKKRSKICLKS
ncbi:MAG: LAGLIDADG family homing endonuclease [Candidatus Omnitrophica bacterium]|nr:LAGLIDADG family homing endonuclease [Candidatus Omnitrophota bacterium]